MKPLLRHVSAVALLAASSFSTATEQYTAHYDVSWKNMNIGSGSTAFSLNEQGHYRLQTDSSAGGIMRWIRNDRVTETSHGRIEAEGVQPQTYAYQHATHFGIKRQADIAFDWDSGQVTNNVSGSRWQMPVSKGVQDKASMQVALLHGLRAGQRLFHFRVADGGHLKNYRFRVTGEDRVETPMGNFNAVTVERRKEDNEPDVFLWCVPKLDYLPVQIVRDRRGRRVTVRMTALEH